jgi:lipopolysaccharide export system permease protein
VTGVLLVILVTFQLTAVLDRAASGRFPREILLTLIGYSSLENLSILVPVGLLLGIVLGFGRLYHESEMAAIHACGVGLRRLYAPVLLLAVVLAGGLTWLVLDLSPRSAERVQQLRAVASRDAQFVSLEPGRFRSLGGEDAVFYAAGAEPDGTLREVFVKRTRDGRLEITTAARARHHVSEEGRLHTFVLEDGRLYEGVPGSAAFRVTQFREQAIPVRLPETGFDRGRMDLKPTRALLASQDPADKAELQWRLSQPLMALVLSLLAVPLSRLRPRQGRYARIGYAILVYFAYSNLLSAATVWMARGQVPVELGLWWVHALMVALALVLLVRR